MIETATRRPSRGHRFRWDHGSAGDTASDPLADRRYSVSTWDSESQAWVLRHDGLTLWQVRKHVRVLESLRWGEASYLVRRTH